VLATETMVAAAPRRTRLGAKLMLLAATIVLLILLDVAAARVYRLASGHPWPGGNPARAYRIPADPYHHGLRPNYSTDGADWGGRYAFRTNSLGFKDAKVRDVPLEPKGNRIVVIGDSFTEGVGVPYEETFAGRLGAALAPEGTEVLNAGVQSYTPIIYYRKIKYLLEEKGLRFHELIVAIDESDLTNELSYELDDDVVRPRVFADRAIEFLKTNSILLLTIAERLRTEKFTELGAGGGLGGPTAADAAKLKTDAEIEAALRKLPGMGRMLWPNDEAEWNHCGEGARCMVENMDRLLAVVKKHGIPLTVVVYPWPDQVIAGNPDCHHVGIWRDWCAKNGVPLVNSFPKFEVGAPWRRRAEVIDACYIPGDQHMNAEGHRRVAEAILEARHPSR
jgi:lysophospholipase L1-like esterase